MKWPSLQSGRDFVALDDFDDLSQRELVGPLRQTRRFEVCLYERKNLHGTTSAGQVPPAFS